MRSPRKLNSTTIKRITNFRNNNISNNNNSWLAERILAVEEGLCSMEFILYKIMMMMMMLMLMILIIIIIIIIIITSIICRSAWHQPKINYRQVLEKEKFVTAEDMNRCQRRRRENTQRTKYWKLNNVNNIKNMNTKTVHIVTRVTDRSHSVS
jgi:uncharacterized membrane protein